MTAANVQRILEGLGYTSFSDIQTPEIRTIFLTTNQGINPDRDFITFDFTNSLIKIKQAEVRVNQNGEKTYTSYTDNLYDVYLDMNLVVGFELVSGKVGCS